MTDARPALALTGERTLPGIWHENYWFRRHEAGYRWVVATLGAGVRGAVVEAGVGEGYGATALARAGADPVLGLDLDLPTLHHLRATHPVVAAARANLVTLPLRDRSVDVVVSAQTVEHLWDQDAFVAGCARVLRPGGRLLLTTPNRRTFPPGNPFHSRELDATELADLVATHLEVDVVEGLHHGPRLRAADDRLGGVVAAQLRAPYDEWDLDLATEVRSVTAGDFAVGPTDGCLDLLLAATRR
ncbi:MAG TPA: class I SAM-dependent methyltransferase [Actinomycetes bacterium]|nr:class I SAM-dependent methyltransferase [Actinomycetes bacterium]